MSIVNDISAAHHVTSHRITWHHITSHHITSHHITSHHIISHHITSYHITSHHITSHRITSYHIASHDITSHRIISHHITSPSHRIASSHFAHLPCYQRQRSYSVSKTSCCRSSSCWRSRFLCCQHRRTTCCRPVSDEVGGSRSSAGRWRERPGNWKSQTFGKQPPYLRDGSTDQWFPFTHSLGDRLTIHPCIVALMFAHRFGPTVCRIGRKPFHAILSYRFYDEVRRIRR